MTYILQHSAIFVNDTLSLALLGDATYVTVGLILLKIRKYDGIFF